MNLKQNMNIAVAISGGGSLGAYSVGCVNAIRTLLNPQWRVVAGTSTGALIGTLIATEQWSRLNKIYSTVKTEDIVKPRHTILGIDLGIEFSFLASALTQSESVLSSDGLQDIIDKVIPNFEKVKNKFPKTLLMYSTTELQSGKTVTFNNRDHDAKTLRKALLASANQPALMEPVTINDKQYVDGGVTEFLPLGAIFRDPEAQNIDCIFAVASSPLDVLKLDKRLESSVSILARTIEVFGDGVGKNDYKSSVLFNIISKLMKNVANTSDILSAEELTLIADKKDIPIITICPDRHITEIGPLEFVPEKMRALIKEGEQTCARIIKSKINAIT